MSAKKVSQCLHNPLSKILFIVRATSFSELSSAKDVAKKKPWERDCSAGSRLATYLVKAITLTRTIM